jgi:GNAT superfamily N-acetyltransferase
LCPEYSALKQAYRRVAIMKTREIHRDDYFITTDKAKLDIAFLHNFLSNSYWAKGRTVETLKITIENSVCFGVFHKDKQIGFARVVTDHAIFAYLADVFINEGYRGRGLSKWLMETIMNYPELSGVKKWMLGTRDAHSLYEKYGFVKPKYPERWMEYLMKE